MLNYEIDNSGATPVFKIRTEEGICSFKLDGRKTANITIHPSSIFDDNTYVSISQESPIRGLYINLICFKGSVSSISEILSVMIELLKPKEFHLECIGMGLGYWDAIVPMLVKKGIYVDSLGKVSYGLSVERIYYESNKDDNTVYKRYIESLRQKRLKKVKELLEYSIENGILVTLYDEKLRGAGKSTSIVEKAKKEGFTILVGNTMQKKYMENLANGLGAGHLKVYYINETDLRGRLKVGEKVILDTPMDVNKAKSVVGLAEAVIVGGFI